MKGASQQEKLSLADLPMQFSEYKNMMKEQKEIA